MLESHQLLTITLLRILTTPDQSADQSRNRLPNMSYFEQLCMKCAFLPPYNILFSISLSVTCPSSCSPCVVVDATYSNRVYGHYCCVCVCVCVFNRPWFLTISILSMHHFISALWYAFFCNIHHFL